ncbi:hypothetical protein Dimus_008696 [Dionaea muscipula]
MQLETDAYHHAAPLARTRFGSAVPYKLLVYSISTALYFSYLMVSCCNCPISCPFSDYLAEVCIDSDMESASDDGEFYGSIGVAAGAPSLHNVFKILDADFFSNDKMMEIVKGATEFNIPTIRANRKLVASVNGGLTYPSSLVFRPQWLSGQAECVNKSFVYPTFSVQRPKKEEDIAYMSVLELGQLIKSRRISSQELTEIFLRRLKRYDPVLEAVVTFTEELAYKQAKEADDLLSQGVYLGT